MAAITVRRADSAGLMRKFVGLPWDLYKDDPAWIPPVRREVSRVASRRHNPFFQHAEIEHFLAFNGTGKPVGRIAACVHPEYNDRFKTRRAFFGFFESVQDNAVAAALFAEVESWAVSHGMEAVVGPYSYAPTQDMGLLVEGFENPAALLQLYNPPYYETMIRDGGYQPLWAVRTYWGKVSDALSRGARMFEEADRLREKYQLTVRPLDKGHIERERKILLSLFNESFSDKTEVVPISEDVFRFQSSSFLPIIDPNLVVFIERAGEVLAMGLALPNFNDALQAHGGKITLKMLLTWKRTLKNIRSAVPVLVCARKSARGMGLSRVLMVEWLRAGVAGGYERYYSGWVDEVNGPMKAALHRMGCDNPDKRYLVFKKDIAEAKGAA